MQTVRERMDELDLWFDAGREPSNSRVLGLLDLTIIDRAAVAMDLKAGARALFRENKHATFDDISGTMQAQYYEHLRAILLACHIIVPDEVGVVEVDEGSWYHGDPPQALIGDTDITGRTVAVLPERNPSESPNSCQTGNSCTGESISHPQVTERE